MAKQERIYTAPVFKLALEGERRKMAEELKQKHNLKNVFIPMIGVTEWLGNKLLNNKAILNYRIKKTGLNSGVVEFI